jgi:phospholipase C
VLTASGRVAPDRFWIDFANTGTAGAHFYVHSAASVRTDGPWRYTVEAGKTLSDYWAAGTPTGAYSLTVLGPNGFLRQFTGNRVTASGAANPEVTLRYAASEDRVYLKMSNTGSRACTFTIRAGNRPGGPWTYPVAAGASKEDYFSVNGIQGWYDLTATTDGFLRRFAGHQENGTQRTSDPTMGSAPLTYSAKLAGSQEVHLDLGTQRTLTGLICPAGQTGMYELSTSPDGTTWTVAAAGQFASDTPTTRTWPTKARYLKLRTSTPSTAGFTPLGW